MSEEYPMQVEEAITPYGRQSYREVIRLIKAGIPFAEVLRLKEALGISLDKLATYLGMSPATMQRRKQSGFLDEAQSDRLMRYERLLERAIEVLETPESAKHWMTTPKIALGGEVPLDFADTEAGAREVENLLGRIEHGVFS